jgi:hypothetical protein
MDRRRPPAGPPRGGSVHRPPPHQANSLETGKFRPKGIVRKDEQRRKAARSRELALRIGAYVLGGAVLAGAAFFFLRPKAPCRQSPARERALKTLLAWKDPKTGEELREALDGSRFNCEESISPVGVFVATVDSAQPPTIWWVDEKRTLHNVNLLSAVYTPGLPAAPFYPEQVQGVGRVPED